MRVAELLHSYHLEIDDIRWYLCTKLCEDLLTYEQNPPELTRFIWSGKLEARLYDMEERFLQELEETMAQGRKDESWIRGKLTEIQRTKQKRKRLGR